jgi:hypothetical protein
LDVTDLLRLLPTVLAEDVDADVVEAQVGVTGLEVISLHYAERQRLDVPQCADGVRRYVADAEPADYQSALVGAFVGAEDLAASLDVAERRVPPRALVESCFQPEGQKKDDVK